MGKCILISLLTIMFLDCKGQSEYNKVKITKIDSTDVFYFFHGKIKEYKKNVVIVSKKVENTPNCELIEVKRTYDFKLSNFLSEDYMKNIPAKPPKTLLIREDGYIIWDGESFLPQESVNIIGKHYCK